ncbi:hypothetical protein GLOIN_2v1776429 [Rhizophagus clarus]|uniref:Uncharacterized protein n=1 Tax=Rhizophagus clarus TaxID=94130 RepID=A0A8H3R4A3_9GLOM|nr:hypothetical protein GLOIN_2v1776429 [Rhizophagus clarus]
MLRNKPRKANIATLPFRIPAKKQRSDNGDDLEQQSNDDHIEQRSDNGDDLEQRSDDDHIEQRSNNEESDEEYETMSSDNEERHDSDISKEKLFVDEALAKDKLPSYDGDFAPYFQNLTTAAKVACRN